MNSEAIEIRNGLLIDADTDSIQQYQKDPRWHEWGFQFANSKTTYRAALLDRRTRYRRIWISSNVRWPCLVPMIQQVHQNHPGTPVFVLHHDATPPLQAMEVYRLALAGQIQFPQTLAELIQITSLEPISVPARETKTSEAELNQHSDYVPVKIEEFLSGCVNHFDVYLKMGSDKFLKISKTKESLDPERVLRYYQTGVENLFILRSAWKQCLNYCNLLARVLISAQSVSDELKFNNVVATGEESLALFQENPVPQAEHLQSLNQFVDGVNHFLNRDDASRVTLVRTYLNQAKNFEHSINVALISVFLGQTLGLRRPATLWQLSTAALLHDVGKVYLPPHLQGEVDTSQCSVEDRVLYESHPLKGAEIVRKIPQIEEIAVQGVEQHHERRDGSGFPRKPAAGSINLFGEIIGIANEFVELLLSPSPKRKFSEINQVMETKVFQKFSIKVTDAFRKTFLLIQK